MIELGLSKITRLLANSKFPWRAIHVAGTNGKGSVCAYVSALLDANGISCGRFTSPHLIDRWDCITVNEKTIKEETFREVEEIVKKRNASENIQASEFELLTATAFEIFTLEKVKIAAVEVGMGGRLDATNVLRDPLVTVITKIGMDHQAFLGKTLEEIAYQKAGIMKTGVPTVLDASNRPPVIQIILKEQEEVKAGPTYSIGRDMLLSIFGGPSWIQPVLNTKPHQAKNMGLAVKAVELALRQSKLPYNPAILKPTLESVVWPGRLQFLSIESLTGRKEDVLVDGAHNVQSAHALALYVRKTLRKDAKRVTWLVAMSQGKDFANELFRSFNDRDNAVFTEFGPVDGMPWVAPMPAKEIQEVIVNAKHIRRRKVRLLTSCETNLSRALEIAAARANGGPLVVCGSLYLVSDLFRLLRDKSISEAEK